MTQGTLERIVMEEVDDPAEVSKARVRREMFDRDFNWLASHSSKVYEKYRGKHICVSGEEVFAGDSAQEAIALASAVHPANQGSFVQYIPKEKMSRIYADHHCSHPIERTSTL